MGMVQDTHQGYAFHQQWSEPGDFGYSGTARKRTWVIGCNEELTTCLFDPHDLFDTVKAAFKERGVVAQVHDYLLASPSEVLMESQHYERHNYVRSDDPHDLRPFLSERELSVKLPRDVEYRRRFPNSLGPESDPDLVYFLGDSENYLSWSAVSGKVPTFRMTKGKYWLPAFNRWMTHKEKLLAMGFPCAPELARSLRVPLIGVTDFLRAADVCGNSMHFQSAGIWQLIALSCFGPAR